MTSAWPFYRPCHDVGDHNLMFLYVLPVLEGPCFVSDSHFVFSGLVSPLGQMSINTTSFAGIMSITDGPGEAPAKGIQLR